MQDLRIHYLFTKYFDKTATIAERDEFMQYVSSRQSNDEWFELMETAYNSDQPVPELFTSQMRERILDRILNDTKVSDAGNYKNPNATPNKIKSLQYAWIKYAVAALLTGIIISIYFYSKTVIQTHTLTKIQPKQDIAPAQNKAILILADGSKISLDDASSGLLAKQGNTVISKTKKGQIVYNNGNNKNYMAENIIETPNGGYYNLVLPDGTSVWLNAGSSLKYPVAFSDTERSVNLTGEAYFEVAKNKHKPFLVRINNGTEVKVLGTHFNINAYTEKNTINTTLLEGAVLMTSGTSIKKLKPGQQAKVYDNMHNITLQNNVDINEVMAWKNGYFSYHEIDLQTLMSEVERWYNVKVIYKYAVNPEFIAKLPRNLSLSELLNLIELTKKVRFKVTGKIIEVMQ